MQIVKFTLILFFSCASFQIQFAQTLDSIGALAPQPKKSILLLPSDTLSKKRLHWYIGSAVTASTAGFTGLYFLWYDKVPQSSFHFFNDLEEWNQIDKTGHLFGAYFQTKTAFHIHKWAGVSDKKAIWYAGFAGFTLHSMIEVFDGFSQKWGASASDLAFNAAGSMFYVSQELAWHQQRIKMKYSFHGSDYADPELQTRNRELYGKTLAEKILKDYNGINLWFSFCPADFNPKQKHVKWLGIALGYGAGGMFGGFDNKWISINAANDTTFHNRNDVVRYRRFLIAPDIDLEKIPVKKPGWKLVLGILNYFKFPSPALEFNTKGEIILHPIYTFGLDLPLYIKR